MVDESVIGPIMKAARKFRKLNQSSVAAAIGCSQSALSKMEHNLLVPSASQWFLFARFTAIPPENIELGVIDRGTKIRFNDSEVSKGYKIPKKYRSFRSQKVRELYPFIHYLQQSNHSLDEFYQFTKLEREFFVDFDNLINFSLYLDTIDYFIRHDLASPEVIRSVVELGQGNLYWDRFGMKQKTFKDVKELLLEFVEEQVFFQLDFQLLVESYEDIVSVSYVPEFHLRNIGRDVSPGVIEFLNLYRQYCLEHLVEMKFRKIATFKRVQEGGASPFFARFESINQAS